MDGAEKPRAKHLPILVENPRELAASQIPPETRGELAVVPLSRDRHRHRSGRQREVRGRTISVRRLPKRELLLLLEQPREESERPKTREECKGGVRPCPFVSCAHNLYLDVSAKTGAIKLNFPDLEPDELGESCALDVADQGGETLEGVGAILNLTRERIRQIENRALAKLRERGHLREHLEDERQEDGELEDERPELELLEEFDVETFLALEDAGRGPEAA